MRGLIRFPLPAEVDFAGSFVVALGFASALVYFVASSMGSIV